MSLQPAYILRGHASHVHSVAFIRCNTRLVTGDADGWMVVWNVVTRRATAVWRAHEAAVLTLSAWGEDRLITHGKDNRLMVWKFSDEDEPSMSRVLPIDRPSIHPRPPWLLHILHVNTLNFCSFASCRAQDPDIAGAERIEGQLLIALPNAITSENVDILRLPSETRLHTVVGHVSVKTGMVMAVALCYCASSLTLMVGYESGHTMISRRVNGEAWHILYLSQPHSQPILSLAILPDQTSYYTSSADALIAKHNIPNETTPSNPALLSSPIQLLQTKHSGQQSLQIRSDGKILATAGWDNRIRVYSTRILKELAVLKWHKQGCFAVAFAVIMSDDEAEDEDPAKEEKVKGELELVAKGTEGGKVSGMGVTGLVVRRREARSMATHWLAAGSKDGMVSLWEVY